MPDSFADLEARKIYYNLFHQKIPPILVERFSQVSARLDAKADQAELDAYRRIIRQVDDLEALEIACRFRNKCALLSRKFHIMVYLAETLPRNQSFFINERSSFIKGLWEIGMGGLRTIGKALKGFWLCTR